MQILGISAFYHDSAATLIRDGMIIAAAQEERFSRKKHDPSFPKQAISYCLKEARSTVDDVDLIVFYEKPFIKFERLVETYLANSPRGFTSFRLAIPVWMKEKLFQKANLIKALKPFGSEDKIGEKLLFAEHHQSHAASAFYPSPFEEAVVLTLDGVGEWATASVSIARGNHLEMTREIRFPHSLGLLYSAFTYYTGFRVNSGEYKLMGLAPYGEPKYERQIFEHLIDLKQDGSFWLDQSYFDYATALTMTSHKFHELFGGAPRQADDPLTQRHMDLAASVQKVTEEIMLRITRELAHTYQIPESVHGRRSSAKLCRQRKNSPRWLLQSPLGATSCWRCRRFTRRCPCGMAHLRWKGAHPKRRLGRYARLISRTGVWPARDRVPDSQVWEQASKCSKTRLFLTAPWIVS